ncbi:MAG: DedA family protein [Ilumatobacteraceae bacterium]
MLSNLASWVQDVIESLGYSGVALLVIAENLFPPIPSEIVLPFAGFVARRGDGSVIVMVVASTIGSVIGALVLYAIAAAIGPERIHSFVVRFGKWFGVKESDMVRAEEWFDRRSNAAVLVGRCVPLIRSLVSIPAGFRRMKFVPFITLTAIGSAVWNIALIGAGAVLGDQWDRVGEFVGIFQWLVVAAIFGVILKFAWSKVNVRRAR